MVGNSIYYMCVLYTDEAMLGRSFALVQDWTGRILRLYTSLQ